MPNHPHLDTLTHCCFPEVNVTVQVKKSVQSCAECNINICDAMAEKSSLPTNGANCPLCGKPMTHTPGGTTADVRAVFCMDKFRHYPQLLREGKITPQEYADWFATLTPKEKMGYYERVPLMPISVRMTEEECSMKDSDPSAFQQVVNEKLKARAEIFLQYELQHFTAS